VRSVSSVAGAVQGSKRIALLEILIGLGLIEATVWSAKPVQLYLFWISAAWFLCHAALAAYHGKPQGLGLPQFKVTAVLLTAPVFLAGTVVANGAALGTLHHLFGTIAPVQHASTYIIWAIVQQYLQQSYFFVRFEQIISRGVLASFVTAAMFGIVHLPNPVLAPVTFVGGWILSEIFRRYRCVVPLGIAHGLVGLAIAVTVPDHLLHHMRVGLSYLTYPH
jgi:Type II CAAX prenyl endopeptidase Rce1-like